MPQEAIQTLLEWLGSVLQYLLPTSVVGLLGLYLAWITLLPQLRIEGVSDKSKRLSSKSKLIIKNCGKMTAYSVKADVENVCMETKTSILENCAGYDGPILIGKLFNDESSEISVSPGIGVGNMDFDKFSCIIILKYYAKILGFKKEISRKWKIELSKFEDGYSWNLTIL